jgi:hypothetical protein
MQTNVEELAARLSQVEDRLQIYDLMAFQPMSTDVGHAGCAEALWTDDGWQDRGGNFGIKHGGKTIAAGLKSEAHRAAMTVGVTHFVGLPVIEIDGDEATATNYLLIVTPLNGPEQEIPNHGASSGFRIHRAVTNRWELVRTHLGWKFKSRTIRLCDGSEAARQLLQSPMKSRSCSDEV